MIGRVNIEGPKSHNAMNAWQPQASYPCGNLSDTFFFVIKRINRPTSPCHILKRKVKLALSPDTCAIIWQMYCPSQTPHLTMSTEQIKGENYLWVYNPTLSNFGFRMIGRVNIEGPKSHNAMNAWQPQASYPCGNLSDTFFFVIKRINRPTSPCHILKRKVKLALSPDTCAIIWQMYCPSQTPHLTMSTEQIKGEN